MIKKIQKYVNIFFFLSSISLLIIGIYEPASFIVIVSLFVAGMMFSLAVTDPLLKDYRELLNDMFELYDALRKKYILLLRKQKRKGGDK